MLEPCRVFLLRHGQTDWNAERRLQGHLDIALNTTGIWQAGQVARALAGEAIDAIYASDLLRAWQTANAIAHATEAPLLPHPGLDLCVGFAFNGFKI